jgi:hypothetical protein
MALVISAILSARWPRHLEVQIILALVAIGGFIYTLVVLRRAFGVPNYTMVLEDWMQREQEKTANNPPPTV